MKIPFFNRLEKSQRILIAGCGGGFDIFCGLPLYFYLKKSGKEVFLASYSFANLNETDAQQVEGGFYKVARKTKSLDYFPEKLLVDWLEQQEISETLYSFPISGVIPLEAAYSSLVDLLKIDTIILVDGGTDSILKGNEQGMGTIVEDATSICAVSQLDIPQKLIACLGFGIDHFHGVSHHSFLENTAELTEIGGFLGSFSLLEEMPEVQAYLAAINYANEHQPNKRSIVNNSIHEALKGRFGDVQTIDRTANSQLFINPLMNIYWFYDIPILVKWAQFYDAIKYTYNYHDVWGEIHKIRENRQLRPVKNIPL